MIDVTVIVPLYKGKKYILNIVSQIEREAAKISEKVELLFVNDDPQESITAPIESALIDIKVFNSQVNRGIQGARVYGLKQAQGRFILFLDQDDLIYENYFSSQLAQIGDADAIVCRCVQDRKMYYTDTLPFAQTIQMDYLLDKGNCIVSPGQVLLRRTSLPDIWSRVIMKTNCADDYYLWICMMAESKRFALNQEVLFEHVVSGSNLSIDYVRLEQSEREMHGILKREKVLKEEALVRLSNTFEENHINRLISLQRYRKMAVILNRMLICSENGYSIADFFKARGIESIGIYGAGDIGMRLRGELKRGGLEPICFIDQNADYIQTNLPIYKPESVKRCLDAFVITLIKECSEVQEKLQKRYPAKVYLLQDILDEMDTELGAKR